MKRSMLAYLATFSVTALVVSSLVVLQPPAHAAGLGATSRLATLPSGAAPGGPGTQSYLDTSRKDCFGTAANTTSKAWYTVADGVLSDVYSPTIENTNNATLQYVVTDGPASPPCSNGT